MLLKYLFCPSTFTELRLALQSPDYFLMKLNWKVSFRGASDVLELLLSIQSMETSDKYSNPPKCI